MSDALPSVRKQDLLAALRALHDVCARMDAEVQADRPSEDEYQTAMSNAAAVIKQAEVIHA